MGRESIYYYHFFINSFSHLSSFGQSLLPSCFLWHLVCMPLTAWWDRQLLHMRCKHRQPFPIVEKDKYWLGYRTCWHIIRLTLSQKARIRQHIVSSSRHHCCYHSARRASPIQSAICWKGCHRRLTSLTSLSFLSTAVDEIVRLYHPVFQVEQYLNSETRCCHTKLYAVSPHFQVVQ